MATTQVSHSFSQHPLKHHSSGCSFNCTNVPRVPKGDSIHMENRVKYLIPKHLQCYSIHTPSPSSPLCYAASVSAVKCNTCIQRTEESWGSEPRVQVHKMKWWCSNIFTKNHLHLWLNSEPVCFQYIENGCYVDPMVPQVTLQVMFVFKYLVDSCWLDPKCCSASYRSYRKVGCL